MSLRSMTLEVQVVCSNKGKGSLSTGFGPEGLCTYRGGDMIMFWDLDCAITGGGGGGY